MQLTFLSLYRNLPYKITTEEMYDIFGKYGGIRQIRMYVDVHVLFAVGILLKGLHVCHA